MLVVKKEPHPNYKAFNKRNIYLNLQHKPAVMTSFSGKETQAFSKINIPCFKGESFPAENSFNKK
ncbi:hypothetical protein [Zooshikella ganghwensis]|uniref:Uncharacterized protein n=1 Tax=Zooshikella ganghwensis TaxID=202772 RepID=A0A4P9VVL4_9GAMM|nr:hypothetical protein [Zooshikella ganghwensis]RDH45940.1 hypothetical protein B9G39_22160 [Zooshikella ganghwensis]